MSEPNRTKREMKTAIKLQRFFIYEQINKQEKERDPTLKQRKKKRQDTDKQFEQQQQ